MVNFTELSLMTHLSQKAVSKTHVPACVCMCIVYVYMYQYLHTCMLTLMYVSR